MARNKPTVSETAEASEAMVYANDVLDRTADILVAMGHSPRALAKRFALTCRRMSEPAGRVQPDLVPYPTQLGHVLAHWYGDPDYLDTSGRPIGLPLSGARSLTALIGRVMPGRDVKAAVTALLTTRTIRRRAAHYHPVRRFVSTAEAFPLAHAQSLNSIRGLLHTVQHNLACANPERRLLERKVANLYVPVRLLPRLHRHFKREVSSLLERLDRLLAECEVPPGREPTTSVHLVTFAHEDPCITCITPPARKSRGARRRRR